MPRPVYKALAALLFYPTDELQAALPAIAACVGEEAGLGRRTRRALDALVVRLAGDDLYTLQENYVLLFDRSRSLSLHLFEHIHGESRDRGQAMTDLLALYERHGLAMTERELPDYLPLFLEFLSLLPGDAAAELLGQTAHILDALATRLARRDSPYAAVFEALCALAESPPAGVEPLVTPHEDDPADLAALDRAWEDAAVTFMGGAGAPGPACPASADVPPFLPPHPVTRA